MKRCSRYLTVCAKTIEDCQTSPGGVNKKSGNAYSVQIRTLPNNNTFYASVAAPKPRVTASCERLRRFACPIALLALFGSPYQEPTEWQRHLTTKLTGA